MSKQKLMEVLYPVWVWCRRKSYLVSSVDTCEFELMNFTWYHCRFITAKGIYYQMNFYIPLRKRPSGISISWPASRRKRHWVGLFSAGFFFLVVLSGGRPYIVIGMIAVARLITCTICILLTLCFCQWSDNVSYVCFFFVNNGIHWSCKSHDRKWPGKQKLGRVETNYSLGIEKAKLSLGRLN